MSLLGERAAEMARVICKEWNVGYSQPDRWNIRPGGNADCSSLAGYVYNDAGIYPPFPEDNRTWTGNLRAQCAVRGFEILPWYYGIGLVTGDALLSERDSGGTGHVAVYAGGTTLYEAWVAENNTISGAPGDQTGQETREKDYFAHPLTVARRWTHVLRPPAAPLPRPEELIAQAQSNLTRIEELMAKIKAAVVFFQHKNAIFRANALAGTYSLVPNPTSLRDQKAVLDKLGIPWIDYGEVATNPIVKNAAAFGVLIKDVA